MDKEQILQRLGESTSEQEWNTICDDVKANYDEPKSGEYPQWWFAEVVLSGLATGAQVRWVTP